MMKVVCEESFLKLRLFLVKVGVDHMPHMGVQRDFSNLPNGAVLVLRASL